MTSISPARVTIFGAVVIIVTLVMWRFVLRPAAPVPPASAEIIDIVPDPLPPDPRLTFSTNFRNVGPDVRYVGDSSCLPCHGEICSTYHAHPMGRSAEIVNAASVVENYDPQANNPCKVGNYELFVAKTANGAVHRVAAKDGQGNPLPEYKLPIGLAIGSGTRGRSYLSVENGSVWQSPVSWFSAESKWDVSPGFDLGTGGRRAIVTDCLFCHVNQVEPISGSVNRYREPLLPGQGAIGCERCHGPGELHVTERLAAKPAGKTDASIVNPKHLNPSLQAAICQQCHLQGQERVARRGRQEFEFRPGLPFDEFVTVFVRHPDLAEMNRSVGQFEQLEVSHCKTADGGSLSCTSCHDPHKTPSIAGRDQFFRDRCVACHETRQCAAPLPDRRVKGDNCASCHMPKAGSSNIAHASVTDHRIMRRPVPPPPPRGLSPGATPLIPFKGGSAASPAERERDFGIALARLTAKLPPGSESRQLVAGLARDRLVSSLKIWRGDAEAWEALSQVHGVNGDATERLAVAERSARLSSDSEISLMAVTESAHAAGRLERAEEAASALTGMNPRSVDHLLNRALVRAARKQWPGAEEDCRSALRIQPLHPRVRLLLGICLHKQGNSDAGEKEADTAIGLATKPPQQKALRDWFEREIRLRSD